MDLNDLKEPICAVIELAIQPFHPGFDGQPVRPLMQVVLRPDKVTQGLIRLGETPGDEALCWIAPHNINIVAVLGRAVAPEQAGAAWKVVPYDQAAGKVA